MPSRPQTPRRAPDLALALALLGAVVAVGLARYRPPEPAGRDASPESFSAVRAGDVLQRFLGDGAPRPSGTPAHARARERILAELAALGVEASVQETLAIGPSARIAVVRNVVSRLAGTGQEGAILLAAHYDSVGASPGAADDGAGVASLIEIARALRAGRPLERAVVLLFSDAAEPGSIGASAFVEQHPWASEVAAAIELEARGTGGPSVLAEINPSSGALVAALARSWPRPLASSAADLVHKRLPSETDLALFRARGIPGLGLAFVGGAARFHTDRDELSHLDLGSVQHQGEIALAAVRALDRAQLGRSAGHERTFTDVLGLAVVHWPARWNGPIAIATLALALAAAWRARRRFELSRSSALAALALATAVPAATAGAAWLSGFALRALDRGEDPASCAPLAAQTGLGSLALAIALGLGAGPLARRAGAGALVALEILLASCAALVIALAEPSALCLAVLPALGAGALAFAGGRRAGIASRSSAVVLPALVAAVWLPVAVVLAHEFGSRSPAIRSLPLAVIGTALLPAAASAPPVARRAALCAAALALGAFAVVAAAPASSSEAPEGLDIRYILDHDRGAARIEVSTFGTPVPARLAVSHPFQRARTPPFPWLSLDRSLFVAPAEIWAVPGPVLEVLWDGEDAAGRLVRARIGSPRGATRLHLHLSPGVEITAARWNDHAVERGFARAASQLFFAVGPEGVEVELRTASRDAFDLWLLDQDWSLPAEIAALVESRPDDRCRRADGDVSIVGRRHRVAALGAK